MVAGRLFQIDQQVVEGVADQRLGLLTEFFLEITALGSLTFAIVIIFGLWLLDDRDHAALLTVGVLVAGLIVAALKWVTARSRPEAIYDAMVHTSLYAFPSGHAAVSFVLAVILSDRFPHARLYFYGLAILVAVSRVYLGVHFVTDVVAGAGIGFIIGWAIVQYQEQILEHVHRINPRL